MIKLADYRTENALPSEMKTPERIALSYAFDMQKKKYFDRVRRVYIWVALESVSDDKLDFLAVENRVLFYNPSLAPSVKRNMIRNSVYWYMKLGTKHAMEEMIATYYPDSGTEMEEWFEYDGKPYHFRIKTTLPLDEKCYAELKELIKNVKNARSRLDQICTLRQLSSTLYAQAGTTSIYKNPPLKEGGEVKRCIENGLNMLHSIEASQKQVVQ